MILGGIRNNRNKTHRRAGSRSNLRMNRRWKKSTWYTIGLLAPEDKNVKCFRIPVSKFLSKYLVKRILLLYYYYSFNIK